MLYFTITLLLLVITPNVTLAEVYKYKNNDGKWVFSDTKPLDDTKVETIEYAGDKDDRIQPKLSIKKIKTGYGIVIKNPYFAPVEIKLESSIFKAGHNTFVVDPVSTTTIHKSPNRYPKIRYKWTMGDPKSIPDSYRYHFPVSSKRSHRITQSFHGSFSHSKRPSLNAVDIALDVGTYISAARGGTVILTKDDYHMGGKNTYFLDKANYVKILHEDGTYALYAHILLGSAMVKPGDKVKVGDRIARSGSSGYSTGPHLHFVIQRNTGLHRVSVPFSFIDNTKKVFTPRRGMIVDGILKDTY